MAWAANTGSILIAPGLFVRDRLLLDFASPARRGFLGSTSNVSDKSDDSRAPFVSGDFAGFACAAVFEEMVVIGSRGYWNLDRSSSTFRACLGPSVERPEPSF
jgi:hypothetical protein